MLRTRMLAPVIVSALGAIAVQPIVAEEPAATPPPAKSIREWMAPPSAEQGADPAAASPATSIREWRSAPGQTPAASTAPAKSIREWRTTPGAATEPCPMTAPIASVAATPAKPAAGATASTSPVTISFKSSMRQGNLVVLLDGVPVFNEKFQKPLLAISQTTTWDPLRVAAGTHRLTAKVHGTKKTYISKTYDLQLSNKGAALRFVMQGDKLTVALGS